MKIKPITDKSCPKCKGQRYVELEIKTQQAVLTCLNCGREEWVAAA